MKPKHLVVALVFVGVLLTGVALLLVQDDDAATPTVAQPEPERGPAGLPSFHAELGESRPAEPIEVPTLEAGPDRNGASATRSGEDRQRFVGGRIVRVADGSPLAGARVAAGRLLMADKLSSSEPTESTATTTGADGSFGLRPAADATVLFVTSANAWPERLQRYDLEPSMRDATDVQLRFDSGFSISGLVLDASGRRLRDALVDVNGVVQEQTDETGHFDFRDVAPEAGVASVRVSARAPGHASAGQDVLVPRNSAEQVNVELRLPPGGAIAGRVTDSHGAPLAGVQAVVTFEMTRTHGGQVQDGLYGASDEHGEYRIESVPEGRYVVEVGYGAGLARAGGEFAIPGPLELKTPALDEGLADSEVSVRAQIAKQVADSKGLALRWFPEIAVAAGQTTRLDVELFPPASLSGRVIDEGGAPAADAHVTLERIERWPAPDVTGTTKTSSLGLLITSSRGPAGEGRTELAEVEARVRTDARGNFELTGLMDGDKRLSVTAAGLVSQARALDVLPAETRTGVDFVLQRGLSVRGRVRDLAGVPIEGANVEIRQLEESAFTGGDLTTDAEGRFELSGLPPGPKQLLVFRTGYASLWKHVDPGGGELQLTMKPAPRVIGLVTHALHGGPITNFDVSLSYEGSTWANTGGTYPEGRFEMPIDSDAPCTVTVRSAGFREVVLPGVLPSRTEVEPLQVRLIPQ